MVSAIAEKVQKEIDRCEGEFGPFHSLHEGLAVLREAYKELEDAIFWGVHETGDTRCVLNEAIQVAAEAMRIAMMVSPVPVEQTAFLWEEV
jgi:hypothetical protein